MFITLAIILAILWILGLVVWHVASAAYHILLGLAVLSLIVHLIRWFRRPRRA